MDLIRFDIVQTELSASFVQSPWFPNEEKKTSPPLHKLSGLLWMLIPPVLHTVRKKSPVYLFMQNIVVVIWLLSNIRLFVTPGTACSTPGFPVHHCLLKLAQTHVHQVGDAVQPSHLLLSPSSPALSLSQHQGQSIGASASASVFPVNIQC